MSTIVDIRHLKVNIKKRAHNFINILKKMQESACAVVGSTIYIYIYIHTHTKMSGWK